MITAALMPQVRDDLSRSMGSGLVEELLLMHERGGGGLQLPNPEAAMPRREGVTAYARRLEHLAQDATLFHVTDEMTELARTAYQSMPKGYALREEDLPAQRGLIVYDRPISTFNPRSGDRSDWTDFDRSVAERYGEENMTGAEIIGVLWGPALDSTDWPGVLTVLFQSAGHMAEEWVRIGRNADAIRQLRSHGELSYHDEVVLPFGEWAHPADGPDVPPAIRTVRQARERAEGMDTERVAAAGWEILGTDPRERFTKLATGAARLVTPDSPDWTHDEEPGIPVEPVEIRHEAIGVLLVTWHLMRQPLVSSDPEPLPRNIRRARERANKPVPAIRIVRLRHPRRESAGKDTRRTYRHRWVVTGHWRNQACGPGRSLRRPTYIFGYIKGKPGAPLLGSEKIYDWRD